MNISRKAWIQGVALAGALLSLSATHALAGSRSSLVFVSVRVVDSCRVDATGNPNGKGVDFNMRCSSLARPSVRMETNAPVAGSPLNSAALIGLQPETSVSLSASGSEQVVRIDF